MKRKEILKLFAISSFLYTTPLMISAAPVSTEAVYENETDGPNLKNLENDIKIVDEYLKGVADFYQMPVEKVRLIAYENMDRLLQSNDIEKELLLLISGSNQSSNSSIIKSRYDRTKIDTFKSTYIGNIMVETSNMFGIDPSLMIALCTQESGLDHDHHLPTIEGYHGSGYGITQQENTKWKNGNSMITGKKYTESGIVPESVEVSEANAIKVEKNIKMGVIYLQSSLEHYHNNIFLALQGYNYGSGMMDIALNLYAKETGLTREQIMDNYSDLGWMKYVEEIHYNPSPYIEDGWDGYYGDGQYIFHVLSYIGKDIIYIKTETGELLYHLGNMNIVSHTLEDGTEIIDNVENVTVFKLENNDATVRPAFQTVGFAIQKTQQLQEAFLPYEKVFTMLP